MSAERGEDGVSLAARACGLIGNGGAETSGRDLEREAPHAMGSRKSNAALRTLLILLFLGGYVGLGIGGAGSTVGTACDKHAVSCATASFRRGTGTEHNQVNAYGSAIFFVSNDHKGNIRIDRSVIRNNIGGSWYPHYNGISAHDDTPISSRQKLWP